MYFSLVCFIPNPWLMQSSAWNNLLFYPRKLYVDSLVAYLFKVSQIDNI